MNDIDRSVESLDFALRRRFAWKEIRADDTCFDRMMNDIFAAEESALRDKAKRRYRDLNDKIGGIEALGESYKIGPAYFRELRDFKKNDDGMWKNLWDNHLSLLLGEYLRGVPTREAMLKELWATYDAAK